MQHIIIICTLHTVHPHTRACRKHIHVHTSIKHTTPHTHMCTHARMACSVDECAANNGGCEQVCTNMIRGHNCSCRSGFLLEANGQNCTGKISLFILWAIKSPSPRMPAAITVIESQKAIISCLCFQRVGALDRQEKHTL